MMENKFFDLVITHNNCMDGVGVAMAVTKFNLDNGYFGPAIKNVDYSDIDDEEFMDKLLYSVYDKDVLIGDFSFDESTLVKIWNRARSLIVLDHHNSVPSDVRKLGFFIFADTESGATLTYKYLFKDANVPPILNYIRDRDLWLWELPHSKVISEGMNHYGKDNILKDAISLLKCSETDLMDKFYDTGKIIHNITKKYTDDKIKRMSNNMVVRVLGKYDVSCINNGHLISETGNAVATSTSEPFSIQYFMTNDSIVFGFRSIDSKIDVGDVAVQLGGGGHRNASGCSFPLSKFNFNKFFKDRVLDNDMLTGYTEYKLGLTAVNLTGEDIALFGDNKTITYAKSDTVVGISSSSSKILDNHGNTHSEVVYELTNLPPKVAGTLYIVDENLLKYSKRDDLISVDASTAIKDETGTIIKYRDFVYNNDDYKSTIY